MTYLNEGRWPLEGLISEGEQFYSRDAIKVAAEQTIVPGQVLGAKIPQTTRKAVAAKFAGNAANTGDLTLNSTTPFTSAAKLGVYRVICISVAVSDPPTPARFRVEDPNGVEIGQVATGEAGFDGEVKFTIAVGTTAYSIGEGFTITISDDAYKVTAAKFAVNAPNTGDLTLASPPIADGALEGIYTVTCITTAPNGGTFQVRDPRGVVLGNATVGTPYTGQVKFTIADGATDFVVGEGFNITVNYLFNDAEWKVWDPTAVDGSQFARAIALYPITTGVGKTGEIAAIRRAAQWRASDLVFGGSVTFAQKQEARRQLSEVGIIIRD